MVDETPTSTDRRSRELARRTRRRRRFNAVSTVLILGIVVFVVLVATDTIRFGGTGPTLASGKSAPVVTTSTTTDSAISKSKKLAPTRPLSNAAPLRLWIGGDSLSGELGFQLGPRVSKLGIVKAHVDYKVSSGLASTNVRNWPDRFQQEQQQYQPEAVIFMVGANDAPIVGSAVDATGTPVWETKYRAQVDRMMDLLVGGLAQRSVIWIGSPTLGTKYNHGAEEVDRVMREEAAKRPTVVYYDAFSLFAVNGQYSSSLLDEQGQRVQMRVGDGVHFTPKGAAFFADHVFQLLDSRWHLTGQAEPDHTIPYTIEPSSSNVGGVHIGNGNSGSNSSTTTSPTTTPATTAPKNTVPTSTAPTTSAPTTVPATTPTT